MWCGVLTIDVSRQLLIKHGARLAGLDVHNHLLVLVVGVHALDGIIQLTGIELAKKRIESRTVYMYRIRNFLSVPIGIFKITPPLRKLPLHQGRQQNWELRGLQSSRTRSH